MYFSVDRPKSYAYRAFDPGADLLFHSATEGTVRLSIGLENANDQIEDRSRAPYASQKA